MSKIPNLVTIDLDDRQAGSSADLEQVVNGLLDALARRTTPATFFSSRSVAEAQPSLLNRISEAGHEVACLSTTTPAGRTPYCAAFREQLTATKKVVEAATGVRACGHRATGFGVDCNSEWAYDVLVDEGFEYDSSRFPTKYTEYGATATPTSVHAVQRWGGTLLEVPATTADILSLRIHIGTTSDVRGLPLAVWRHVVETRQARGEPVVLHLRAGEFRRSNRFTLTKSNGVSTSADGRALARVASVLGLFQFTSVAKALPLLRQSAPIIES